MCWCVSVLLFFFFSSRRRHTRSLRDWSSDVCSSDLYSRASIGQDRGGRRDRRVPTIARATGSRRRSSSSLRRYARSEERRVGKECRSRWSPYHEKKREERVSRCVGRWTVLVSLCCCA